ncbi:hypothetical protein [Subtercola endophyticus]|uniref:hypothetical protein n=1 Tax=Subtercola endophyticus TaxID=2895559 RepID=UPI001E528BF8|nr:hypothetical protein [Subtercola endophyticus]UFS58597.1 hypothetical protein LQ955_16595 [Subtercola endophyticus]
MDNEHSIPKSADDLTRRQVTKAAAWSIPVVAIAVAAPMAAASVVPPSYAIESSFGVGWYPTAQGQTATGALQYDASSSSAAVQYLRVTGTSAGDSVAGVYIEVLISVGWPAPTFTALPGSNPSWSTLANTGATRVVSGVTYRVYKSTYTGAVVATGSTTNIPINFYFRSSSPYYAGQTVITQRYATVNSTPVVLIRNPATINNTNVILTDAPHP